MTKCYLKNLMTGERYRLRNDEISLGRGKNNSISLDDAKVSREHLYIRSQGNKWVLRDNNSTNGTFLNGVQVGDDLTLQDGDVISVGSMRYVFCHEDSRVDIESANFSLRSDTAETDDIFSKTANIGVTDIFEKVKDQNDDFSLFYVFSQRIHGFLDRDKTLKAATKQLNKLLKSDMTIYLRHPEESHFDVTFSYFQGNTPPQSTLSKNIMLEAITKQLGLLSTESHEEGSVMCVPLLSHEFEQGVFYLYRSSENLAFKEADLKLATAMIQHLALQCEIIALTEKFTDSIEYNLSIRNSLPSALLVVSNKGVIQHINPAATEIFGKSLHELLGHPLCEFPEFNEVETLLNDACNTGHTVKRTEIYIENNEGERIPTGINCTPTRDHNGHIVGAIANFRDLTEIKQLNNQVKRNQQLAAIGEMSASIAHEIRNPLNSINGFVEIIESELSEGSDSKQYAHIVLEEVNRINGIVEDLLSLARGNNFKCVSFNIYELIESISKRSQMEAEGHNVGFQLINKLPNDIRAEVNSDKLTQVIGNFIRNACDALLTENNGHINMITTLEKSDSHSESWIRIAVQDNGCGIPAEVIDQIFNPFYSTKDNGTGLGLAINQKIVDNMNGRIEVDSAEHLGTTFSILLPAC